MNRKHMILNIFNAKDSDLSIKIYEVYNSTYDLDKNNMKISLKEYCHYFRVIKPINYLEKAEFIPPKADEHKHIIRKLIDFDYLELVNEKDSLHDIVYVCRQLLINGYYCILAEYFSSAYIMNKKFGLKCKKRKLDFISYIFNNKDKDFNLQFIADLL